MMERHKLLPSTVTATHKNTTAANVAGESRRPPNVVARLMGIDAMPAPAKTAPLPQPPNQAKLPKPPLRGHGGRPRTRRASTSAAAFSSPRSSPFRQSKCSLLSYGKPRAHPQELLMQQLKQDFPAWQASSATVPLEQKHIQLLAQENLLKEKIAMYAGKKAPDVPQPPTPTPTRIVILRPIGDAGALGATAVAARDRGMEEFLGEVRQRLRQELHGRPRREPKDWSGPRHMRDAVARDLGERLPWSVSFRAHRYDRKNRIAGHDGAVLLEKPDGGCGGDVFAVRNIGRVRSMTEFPLSAIGECAARDKIGNAVSVDADVVPPHTLLRSFSAPAPGARLSLEGDETVAGEAKPSESRSSGLRGKVSSLRHGLSFGGMLFGRKVHWSKNAPAGELRALRLIQTTPSPPPPPPPPSPAAPQDNSPEPSPPPMSESSHSEFPARDDPNPTSPSVADGHGSPHLLGDLNCILPELNPKSPSEQVEAEKPDRAYIGRTLGETNARTDPKARPIPAGVIGAVEEAPSPDKESGLPDAPADRRMLYDLASEALHGSAGSSLRRWITDGAVAPAGRELVDDVWGRVQDTRNPPVEEMATVDSVAAREVRKSAWLSELCADVYVVARKIERAVFDELIGDSVQEMFV